MSKAIEGAALIVGAAALIASGVGAFGAAAEIAFNSSMLGFHVAEALVLAGASLEAGAIASALTNNRGMNITIRQPAANRQIIYGTQRVGGILVYASTTGSTHNQYNKVVVLANHVCWGIEAIYLDGRRVYFDTSSGGNSTRNGINFGGSADGNTYTGPDGVQYNFGGLVYVEARYGDQSPGDIIGALTANDGEWDANSSGSPYLGGCTYLYVKTVYDPNVFPSEPEIRVTLKGKPVFDPRTGLTAYSSNSALVCADWASDVTDGLGLTVDQDVLIAAANVCDESVVLANTTTEARYACHYHFDTGAAPSDVYSALLMSMGGRRSFVGGKEIIVPAYWQGPSFSFDEGVNTASLQWDATASYKDNSNRVTGTYTAPNFPYNIAGDLYDSNGFSGGMIQNNFAFGFQPTNFPQYAADQQHGFAADQYLNEDSGVTAAWTSGATFAEGDVVSYTRTIAGVPFASVWKSLSSGNTGNTPRPTSAFWVDVAVALPMEQSYNMVLSIVQAQRLAKIAMLRGRSWGAGTFEMGLAAFAMQDFDVMNYTFPLHGWVDKALEIGSVTFKVVTREGSPGELPAPPECRCVFEVRETASSIYEWDVTEEQTIYDLPALPQQQSRQPAPPTSMTLESDASTSVVQPDGTVDPRIRVGWATPMDGFVSQIQKQFRVSGTTPWIDAGLTDVALNFDFIPSVAGVTYDVRIRSLRPNGSNSVWVEIDSFSSGYVLGSTASLYAYGPPGSLVGEAYVGAGAAIICEPFSALFGSVTLSILPAGPFTISGLTQQTLYYVYYIDPTIAGGAITPIATQVPSDFLGKPGYFLIGSITTPFAGTGTRYYPSTYTDAGTRSTVTPAAAFDGDTATSALVSARQTFTTESNGDFIMQGDPAIALGAPSTLNIDAAVTMTGISSPPGGASINVTIGGVAQTPQSFTAATARATYTWTIPSGTPLNTVVVEVVVGANFPTSGHTNLVNVDIFENFIQT